MALGADAMNVNVASQEKANIIAFFEKLCAWSSSIRFMNATPYGTASNKYQRLRATIGHHASRSRNQTRHARARAARRSSVPWWFSHDESRRVPSVCSTIPAAVDMGEQHHTCRSARADDPNPTPRAAYITAPICQGTIHARQAELLGFGAPSDAGFERSRRFTAFVLQGQPSRIAPQLRSCLRSE